MNLTRPQGRTLPHYVTSRPVVLHDDLVAWIESAPTERKTA